MRPIESLQAAILSHSEYLQQTITDFRQRPQFSFKNYHIANDNQIVKTALHFAGIGFLAGAASLISARLWGETHDPSELLSTVSNRAHDQLRNCRKSTGEA